MLTDHHDATIKSNVPNNNQINGIPFILKSIQMSKTYIEIHRE